MQDSSKGWSTAYGEEGESMRREHDTAKFSQC
jgi:hypothetical protein